MKDIGIIGGMGPLATADLFLKIIRYTDAKSDQEHIHIYIDNNTEIPDRTLAVERNSDAPVRHLIRSGIKLEAMGADILVMPCNAAHAFYDRITPYFRAKMLHMIRETASELAGQGVTRAGILATDGTLKAGLYVAALREYGITPLLPPEEEQRAVMSLIYGGIKAGNKDYDIRDFSRAAQALMELGAQSLVLGCTELPLAFAQYGLEYPCVDPTEILAKAAIRAAGYPLKQPS